MRTLTPSPPHFTRGRNHYDGQPIQAAESLTLAQIQAMDRQAARAVLADLEQRNAAARAKLAAAATAREEARKLAAPAASPFPPATPEKKERLKRAQLLRGANTREAARIAAESLTARRVFLTLPDAMKGLAARVSELIPLPDARPEDILSAWLILEPNPIPTTTEKK